MTRGKANDKWTKIRQKRGHIKDIDCLLLTFATSGMGYRSKLIGYATIYTITRLAAKHHIRTVSTSVSGR